MTKDYKINGFKSDYVKEIYTLLDKTLPLLEGDKDYYRNKLLKLESNLVKESKNKGTYYVQKPSLGYNEIKLKMNYMGYILTNYILTRYKEGSEYLKVYSEILQGKKVTRLLPLEVITIDINKTLTGKIKSFKTTMYIETQVEDNINEEKKRVYDISPEIKIETKVTEHTINKFILDTVKDWVAEIEADIEEVKLKVEENNLALAKETKRQEKLKENQEIAELKFDSYASIVGKLALDIDLKNLTDDEIIRRYALINMQYNIYNYVPFAINNKRKLKNKLEIDTDILVSKYIKNIFRGKDLIGINLPFNRKLGNSNYNVIELDGQANILWVTLGNYKENNLTRVASTYSTEEMTSFVNGVYTLISNMLVEFYIKNTYVDTEELIKLLDRFELMNNILLNRDNIKNDKLRTLITNYTKTITTLKVINDRVLKRGTYNTNELVETESIYATLYEELDKILYTIDIPSFELELTEVKDNLDLITRNSKDKELTMLEVLNKLDNDKDAIYDTVGLINNKEAEDFIFSR